jgi:hypothetical protein
MWILLPKFLQSIWLHFLPHAAMEFIKRRKFQIKLFVQLDVLLQIDRSRADFSTVVRLITITALQPTVITLSEQFVQGPFSMLKFRKGLRCVEKKMTENTVMMNNVIAWLMGLRKNDGDFRKDFGEHNCREALQFADEWTYFELTCVQLLKHAPRVFPVFVVLAKHHVPFNRGS